MQGCDANSDQGYTGQDTFDFGESSREACVNGVHEHFGQVLFGHNGPITLRSLIEGCAAQSPASTQHFIQAGANLHRSRDVLISSTDSRILRPSKTYTSSTASSRRRERCGCFRADQPMSSSGKGVEELRMWDDYYPNSRKRSRYPASRVRAVNG